MATMNQNTENLQMYPVHCTECGELIDGKFFPLKKLLEQYYYGKPIEKERAQVIETLGVGVLFGAPILPDVPAMLRKKKSDHLDDENDDDDDRGTAEKYEFVGFPLGKIAEKGVALNTFACENNEIPDHMLKRVNLNISAIVAQFYLMSGFDTIYYMLRLWNKMETAEANQEEIDPSDKYELDTWCDQFAELSCVKLPEMSRIEQRRKDVCNILAHILSFARAEADKPNRRHFATEEIFAGWRYKTVNNRRMPFALVAKGSSGNIYHSTDCCCDKCHRALAYEMGAYRQKLIGILGTQATGKTTYLAALTDAIDLGEATTLIQSNGEARRSRLSIQHSMVDDPQWKRVTRAPAQADMEGGPEQTAGAKAGALWMYRHGFPPEKTSMSMLEAPALSFLIGGEDSSGNALEPVMYTLADIPGEAFSNVADRKLDQLLVEKQHRLLFSCSALIMVISRRQLKDFQSKSAGKADELVRDPNVVLGCYKNFMPDHPVPTAVVLTAADEIDGGNLRRAMQLAYDLRSLSPMVWSGRHGSLVYNAELMKSADAAVKEYINKSFGEFMENIDKVLREKGGSAAIGAFAVSSGTQCAPYDYADSPNPEYRSAARMDERCSQMRQARFGVVAPLLWMLAGDGLLPIGRGDNNFNDYKQDVQAKIQKWLQNGLQS